MGAAIVGPEGFYKKYDDERGDGIKSLGNTNPKGIPLTYEGCTEALLKARDEANANVIDNSMPDGKETNQADMLLPG